MYPISSSSTDCCWSPRNMHTDSCSLVPDDAKATLYATITVLESTGHAIGDPAMQQIFASSLRLPVFWHAMPFFFASVSV